MLTVRQLLCGTGLAFGAAATAPAVALACTCAAPLDPCGELRRSVVFLGTAIAGQRGGTAPSSARFQVDEVFSGSLPRVVDVEGGTVQTAGPFNNGASCGLRFTVGEQYLVYASFIDGRLSTSLCTRTRPLAGHRQELEVLREVKRGVRITRLVGKVTAWRLRLEGGIQGAAFPFAGIRISATGATGASYSTRSDSNGEFRFTGLPADTYSVRGHFPPGYAPAGREPRVVLECFAEASLATATEPLRGVLVRHDGTRSDPWHQIITAVAVDQDGAIGEKPRTTATSTDRQGRWSFRGLPPGRYKVGANVLRKVRWDPAQQPFWYGGALAAEEAKIVEVDDGASEEIELRFPPPPPEIQIRGLLVDTNGAAVADASLSVYDAALEHGVSTAPADRVGRFTARGWQGRRYRLVAYACRSLGLMSEETDANLGEETRVVLTKPCPQR